MKASRPPSARSATVARALAIAASTLRRLRTMPASAISRSTSRLVVGGDHVGVEAGEGGAEGLALVEDGQPGEPGLEGLEGEPLEVRGLAGDAHPPLGVVVGQVHRVARAPRAARDAVDADHGRRTHRASVPQLEADVGQHRCRDRREVEVDDAEAPVGDRPCRSRRPRRRR